ncbi:uncharacterized protein AB675_10919 [Cyphellophora attinorum]|uniref:Uncharacterized protein n=1 Tax=Cyphellophora attinorum TaxID=1664694 RepID=A0A0N1H3N7_9EURO|nr:uncharacterized protein AB675_10919 [Phialophora attinorum]KPI35520.1 hypothetical protein AB675_10919 [Phialophora attinorum]
MPHKHKRKREDNDKADFDLPPTAKAAPLPATSRPKAVVALDDKDGTAKRSNKRRKPNSAGSKQHQARPMDDTPKQFARMMAFQNEGKKLRKGLDDGVVQKPKDGKKKQKKQSHNDTSTNGTQVEAGADSTIATAPAAVDTPALKILPNEKLRDFALRVDQSLPLSSIPKHSTKPPTTEEKAYLTKHNKRLARMQAAWRSDEERLRQKEQQREEDVLDQKEEEGLLWMDVDEARRERKGKRKGKEGDIWAELVTKRKDGLVGGTGGLNAGTAVQAPPVLRGVKNLFKERRDVKAR